MKKNIGHRHGRNENGFEAHRRERGAGDVRQGRAWRFVATGGGGDWYANEPHYRVTARMAALPGKHIRAVREPARSAHGKDY